MQNDMLDLTKWANANCLGSTVTSEMLRATDRCTVTAPPRGRMRN